MPKVFISYAHDSAQHKRSVRRLAELLRRRGVGVVIDQLAGDTRRDWGAWATEHITTSDCVIVVASPQYKRVGDGYPASASNKGAQSESAVLRDLLHSDRATWLPRLLPVILPGRRLEEVPAFLQPSSASYYRVHKLTNAGVRDLRRAIVAAACTTPEMSPIELPPPPSTPVAKPDKLRDQLRAGLKRPVPPIIAAVLILAVLLLTGPPKAGLIASGIAVCCLMYASLVLRRSPTRRGRTASISLTGAVVILTILSMAVPASRHIVLQDRPGRSRGTPEAEKTPEAGETPDQERSSETAPTPTTRPTRAPSSPAAAASPTMEPTPTAEHKPKVDDEYHAESVDSYLLRITVNNPDTRQRLITHASISFPGMSGMCTAGPVSPLYVYTLDHKLVPAQTTTSGQLILTGGLKDSEITNINGEKYVSPLSVELLMGSCPSGQAITMTVGFSTSIPINPGTRISLVLTVPKRFDVQDQELGLQHPHGIRIQTHPLLSDQPSTSIRVALDLDSDDQTVPYSSSDDLVAELLP